MTKRKGNMKGLKKARCVRDMKNIGLSKKESRKLCGVNPKSQKTVTSLAEKRAEYATRRRRSKHSHAGRKTQHHKKTHSGGAGCVRTVMKVTGRSEKTANRTCGKLGL